MNENKWRQLVKEAVEKDKTAFNMLYKETERSVYFLCLKLLGNEDSAKDVVQETYLTAYDRLSTLDDGANFPKWINGIAVNFCKRSFRQTEDISLEEKLEQGEQLIDEENFIPEDYIANDEKRRVIMNIIDTSLPDSQRQTIILYYYNGLSTKEIANLMYCPEGTVTYRLSSARAKIKEAVLIYEEKHGERLHAMAPVPILTQILRMEAERIVPPDIPLFKKPAISKTSANKLKAGGKETMKTALKTKIIAAAAATAVAGGGITAAVLLSKDNTETIPADSVVSSVAEMSDSTAENSEAHTSDESSIPEAAAPEIEYGSRQEDGSIYMPIPEPSETYEFTDIVGAWLLERTDHVQLQNIHVYNNKGELYHLDTWIGIEDKFTANIADIVGDRLVFHEDFLKDDSVTELTRAADEKKFRVYAVGTKSPRTFVYDLVDGVIYDYRPGSNPYPCKRADEGVYFSNDPQWDSDEDIKYLLEFELTDDGSFPVEEVLPDSEFTTPYQYTRMDHLNDLIYYFEINNLIYNLEHLQ